MAQVYASIEDNAMKDSHLPTTNQNGSRKANSVFSDTADAFKLGKFTDLYTLWEAKLHRYVENGDDTNTGCLGEPDVTKPGCVWASYFDLMFRVFIRCEMIYFNTNMTIWDVTAQPLGLWLSRRVSGIYDSKIVVNADSIDDDRFKKYKGNVIKWESKNKEYPEMPYSGFWASGFYGWGKKAILQPGTIVDTFTAEVTNLSLIAALMLTISIPIVNDPPMDILTTDVKKIFFVILVGCSIVGQFITLVCSISILTNIHKCVGGSAGVYLVLSIFDPYNGFRGAIGPGLYLTALASWIMNIFYTVFIIWIKFDVDLNFHTYAWPLMYTGFIVVGIAVYLLCLVYGIYAENICSKFTLKKIEKFKSVETLEKYSELRDKNDTTQRVMMYDISKDIDTMNKSEAALLRFHLTNPLNTLVCTIWYNLVRNYLLWLYISYVSFNLFYCYRHAKSSFCSQ